MAVNDPAPGSRDLKVRALVPLLLIAGVLAPAMLLVQMFTHGPAKDIGTVVIGAAMIGMVLLQVALGRSAGTDEGTSNGEEA